MGEAERLLGDAKKVIGEGVFGKTGKREESKAPTAHELIFGKPKHEARKKKPKTKPIKEEEW